ncbi:hypothetical protein ASE74_13380 [Pedobacter sp. Leaf216]|uniref:hypothetical protein n=1 Tax=Pedobacter sp. Leaf216 TaxID=1735684 RepID=UPI0006FFC91A|nr:hypothetical protein [Pedobacter sp. Leaf216]KQM78490.1 hypothetical protein ASE74_13380 [Pedobacter sp. Leaf216]
MEKQRNSAQRDKISIAEHIDDKRQRLHVPPGQKTFVERSRTGLIDGKIVNLKWKAPSNGIAGLL